MLVLFSLATFQSRANLLNTKSGLEAVSAARDKASDEVKDLVDRLEDVQRQLNDEVTTPSLC